VAKPEKVYESRRTGANFDLFEPDEVLTLHGDGFSNVVFTASSVTLELYHTTPSRQVSLDPAKTLNLGSHEVPEQRIVSGRVTIPSNVFLALLSGIANQVRTGRAEFDARTAIFVTSTNAALEQLTKGNSP
jgi:hypothetical protein